jgi:hypothetical protein
MGLLLKEASPMSMKVERVLPGACSTLVQVLLFAALSFGHVFPLLATEYSQQLPANSDRGPGQGVTGIGVVGSLYEKFVNDEKRAKERMQEAAQQAVTARDPSWKNYYRVEYVGRRAEHVATIVIFLVGTLREKENLERSMTLARARFIEFSTSPEVRGMRRLVVLVMDLADRDGSTSDIEEVGRRAVRDANLVILANLTAEPKTAGMAQRRLALVDERCRGGLKLLRGELAYLEQRLDEIKEQ